MERGEEGKERGGEASGSHFSPWRAGAPLASASVRGPGESAQMRKERERERGGDSEGGWLTRSGGGGGGSRRRWVSPVKRSIVPTASEIDLDTSTASAESAFPWTSTSRSKQTFD